MKIFRCDHCGHPVFFENVQCLHCGSTLAFLPVLRAVCAVEPVGDGNGLWQRKRQLSGDAGSARWRLCRNHLQYQACNFAVAEHDSHPLCVSCRLTRRLPDLSQPLQQARWRQIEVAKRRLFYTLSMLGLVSVSPDAAEGDGPVFEFLADVSGQPAILTGHTNGIITLNVAEADDDERLRRRLALHEPYRTLLGHLRHESGHYYWDKLIGRRDDRIELFRHVFGDASADYDAALQAYYASDAQPAQWQSTHVSVYATAHPWEDWAETWAHYLHMVDLLETAASYNARVVVPGSDTSGHEDVCDPFDSATADFDALVAQWVPVTLLLNSLNRSLGQADAYPFALGAGTLHKLRFVHDLVHTEP